MKFTPLLKSIIVEQSRFEVLYDALTKPSVDKEGKKQKPKLTKQEFITLVQSDPTTRLNNVDVDNATPEQLSKIKVGGYTKWIIKQYLSPKTERQPGENGYDREVAQVKETFMEDLYKVTDDLKKFERFKNKIKGEKDINKLTADQLYDAVKDFDLTLASTTKAERKSAEVHPGSKLVYDGPNWRVIEIEDKGPVGKEAACFYGGNNQETRWCTSTPGTDQWFNRYIKDGPLYVIYNPNDTDVATTTGLPKNRYQFHFPSNQFMDKDDRQQDLVQMLNGPMSELKDFFKPEFAKGLTVGGEKLVIDSFTHGNVGKFIALYGLDDLIGNLPTTLKEFQIQNKDNKNDIIINIPEEIGRFKDLNMIMLDNCVASIPDSVCDLPKLRFLALINNPKLTNIPECVSQLPSLLFLNLKGSPNVQVPKSIKDKGTDMGGGMWDLQTD
jgi:Leucine-rich repeat (LRR) protein